jgi:hypothetical protein
VTATWLTLPLARLRAQCSSRRGKTRCNWCTNSATERICKAPCDIQPLYPACHTICLRTGDGRVKKRSNVSKTKTVFHKQAVIPRAVYLGATCVLVLTHLMTIPALPTKLGTNIPGDCNELHLLSSIFSFHSSGPIQLQSPIAAQQLCALISKHVHALQVRLKYTSPSMLTQRHMMAYS